ncbi:hypothetical protein DKX38_020074 [Salix brachista]|uniref:Uncharacterized protein n=1 Tax=Salix brachista TaxID=2182728 RepID=A0A5N5KHZ3_9ROSI|nr:hypothetical protein DKX38_020074 [Salix brachista]
MRSNRLAFLFIVLAMASCLLSTTEARKAGRCQNDNDCVNACGKECASCTCVPAFQQCECGNSLPNFIPAEAILGGHNNDNGIQK